MLGFPLLHPSLCNRHLPVVILGDPILGTHSLHGLLVVAVVKVVPELELLASGLALGFVEPTAAQVQSNSEFVALILTARSFSFRSHGSRFHYPRLWVQLNLFQELTIITDYAKLLTPNSE